MKKLNVFLEKIDQHIKKHGFDDVMDFIPFFEELNLTEWETLLDVKNGKPTNTLIFESAMVKMILIHWNGLQKSSIHGHPNGGGLIKIISGRLRETRFDPIEKETVIGQHDYPTGEVSYIHDMIALHQVQNPSKTPALSLHMYTAKQSKTA